jgi:TonB family protein
MNMRHSPFPIACTTVLALIAVVPAYCQKTIPEAEARKQISHRADPVYPPIAKAARVQGAVVIAVVIDSSGKVESERVLSGPPMLQQAALDAVMQWLFTPFQENGAATTVGTTLTISFSLPGPQLNAEQENAAQALFPLSDKCRSALKAQDSRAALSACKEALETSFKAGDLTSSDQLGRMDALQLYGHALLLAGKAEEALAEENQAIEESKKCLTDKDQEYAMPFFWRAIVEARLGEDGAALADFTVAENTHRKAILNLPDMKQRYSQYLRQILQVHAALLEQLGKSDEAAKLRAEATAL